MADRLKARIGQVLLETATLDFADTDASTEELTIESLYSKVWVLLTVSTNGNAATANSGVYVDEEMNNDGSFSVPSDKKLTIKRHDSTDDIKVSVVMLGW